MYNFELNVSKPYYNFNEHLNIYYFQFIQFSVGLYFHMEFLKSLENSFAL